MLGGGFRHCRRPRILHSLIILNLLCSLLVIPTPSTTPTMEFIIVLGRVRLSSTTTVTVFLAVSPGLIGGHSHVVTPGGRLSYLSLSPHGDRTRSTVVYSSPPSSLCHKSLGDSDFLAQTYLSIPPHRTYSTSSESSISYQIYTEKAVNLSMVPPSSSLSRGSPTVLLSVFNRRYYRVLPFPNLAEKNRVLSVRFVEVTGYLLSQKLHRSNPLFDTDTLISPIFEPMSTLCNGSSLAWYFHHSPVVFYFDSSINLEMIMPQLSSLLGDESDNDSIQRFVQSISHRRSWCNDNVDVFSEDGAYGNDKPNLLLKFLGLCSPFTFIGYWVLEMIWTLGNVGLFLHDRCVVLAHSYWFSVFMHFGKLASLPLLASTGRESLVSMDLVQRIRSPVRVITAQRLHSRLKSFIIASKRALTGLLIAATSRSTFEKCENLCFNHLDLIENILDDHHRQSMPFEELSSYFSLAIVSRFTFYSFSLWFEDAIRLIRVFVID